VDAHCRPGRQLGPPGPPFLRHSSYRACRCLTAALNPRASTTPLNRGIHDSPVRLSRWARRVLTLIPGTSGLTRSFHTDAVSFVPPVDPLHPFGISYRPCVEQNNTWNPLSPLGFILTFPVTLNGPGPFFLVLLTLAAVGCTSVQWRDPSGADRHVGLLVYRIDELPRGKRLQRVTVGLDLRLSGPDRGVSLGVKIIEATKPDEVRVDDPDQLADLVAAYLQGTRDVPPSTQSLWGVFYLEERLSRDTTRFDATNIGAEARAGPVAPGFSIGYVNSRHVVGVAVEDDAVQIDTVTDEHVLWTLSRQSGSERKEETR